MIVSMITFCLLICMCACASRYLLAHKTRQFSSQLSTLPHINFQVFLFIKGTMYAFGIHSSSIDFDLLLTPGSTLTLAFNPVQIELKDTHTHTRCNARISLFIMHI